MTQWYDALIGFGIIAFVGLGIWSSIQRQTIKETLIDIKEAIQELKGGNESWEVT